MTPPPTVIIGLGANVGDRLRNLAHAVEALKNLSREVILSPIYTCPALLQEGAPKEWNADFLNMAARVEWDLTPGEAIEALKEIERTLGRIDRGRWGPREIDLDILAWGDEVIMEEGLSIPHPGLLKRDFTLVPLADIAPDWRYPIPGKLYGKTAKELLMSLGMPAAELQRTAHSL